MLFLYLMLGMLFIWYVLSIILDVEVGGKTETIYLPACSWSGHLLLWMLLAQKVGDLYFFRFPLKPRYVLFVSQALLLYAFCALTNRVNFLASF